MSDRTTFLYMGVSLAMILGAIAVFLIRLERRQPKARDIALIALLTALTVLVHVFFHATVPIQAGTALVILWGAALGPEPGFLIGALARFVCNFYMGQGPWTPWQMFSWGLLAFLAGLLFQRADPGSRLFQEKEEGKARQAVGQLALLTAAAAAVAFLSYVLVPSGTGKPYGPRTYLAAAAALVLLPLVRRKKIPPAALTLGIYTFLSTFAVYGGIMNLAALVTSSLYPGAEPLTLNALRAVYLTGVPYDLIHAGTAAAFSAVFGPSFVWRIERIRRKYGVLGGRRPPRP